MKEDQIKHMRIPQDAATIEQTAHVIINELTKECARLRGREAREKEITRAATIAECAQLADVAADTLRRDAARARSLGVDCSDSGGTLDHYADMYEGMASMIRSLSIPSTECETP